MGLCKCRRITNLFCFVHRRNVCEHCAVTDHPRCIVRSYLQWLQDGDFDAVCSLCKQSLETGQVVRLQCFDMFHLDCLNQHCAALPPRTAAAGYTCPNCQTGILPPPNMVSPVADSLRKALAKAPWLPRGVTADAQADALLGMSMGDFAPAQAPQETLQSRKQTHGREDHKVAIDDPDDNKYRPRQDGMKFFKEIGGVKTWKVVLILLLLSVVAFVILAVLGRAAQTGDNSFDINPS